MSKEEKMNHVFKTSSSNGSTSGSAPQNENKKKKFDNRNELKISFNGNTTLQKLLECPICFEICIPPIFQCETGHHVCGECRNGYGGKCGSCSAPIRGTRNIFLENYFAKCSFSCCFMKEGCTIVLEGKYLKIHQENCDFSPVLCCPAECEENKKPIILRFSKLLDHIVTNGCCFVTDCNNDGEFDYEYDLDENDLKEDTVARFEVLQVEFSGYTFFAKNNTASLTLSSWVTIFGDENDANKFRVEILIENKNKSKANEQMPKCSTSLRWEGPVLPIVKAQKIMEKEKTCLFTSVHYLLHTICTNDETEKSINLGTIGQNRMLGSFKVKYKIIKI